MGIILNKNKNIKYSWEAAESMSDCASKESTNWRRGPLDKRKREYIARKLSIILCNARLRNQLLY
jgi:hypothetical protein